MRLILLLIFKFLSGCNDYFSVVTPSNQVAPETSWIKQLGFETMGASASGAENCVAATIDTSGNIYCAGFTTGNFGEVSAGSDDAIIIKFNSSGEIQWIRQFGSVTAPTATATEVFYDIKVDQQGNIFASGVTSGSLGEVNAGGMDIFITKLNASGSVQWIKHFGATSAPGGTGHDYPMALDMDAVGNIYIGGQTQGPLFEANGGGYDAFLMKLDSSGNPLWQKQFGSVTAPGAASSGADSCTSIKYKSDSEIYCGGHTASSFGEANGGSNDIVLLKFNSTGVVSWITQLGATTIGANASGSDSCTKIDLDSSGNIYCGATTNGNLGEASGGGNDVLVAKFASTGALSWMKQLGSVTLPGGESSGNESCISLKLDSSGNIFCAGSTNASFGETFGGGTNNPYILKMSSSGNVSWIKQLGADTFPSVAQLTNNICRNVLVSNGQPICIARTGSNFVETNTGGLGDILIFKLKSDGSLDI